MQERRSRRSETPHLALSLFLEALRERESLEAVAVTTEEGLFVAGAGEADVEQLGALGAASATPTLTWGDTPLYVQHLSLGEVPVCLTSMGRPTHGPAVEAAFGRILGWAA